MPELYKKLKIHKQIIFGLIALISIMFSQNIMASEAKQYIQDKCASCHAISKPDFDKSGIAERSNRKGPLLYFAGDKFNKEWLKGWLEAPYRIRPGGDFPPNHTVVTDDGDAIDQKTLPKHPVVEKSMAEDITEYLMGLHAKDKQPLESVYTPKKVSAMMGKMNFNKFKGCGACHRDSEDFGGQSGPELYTAWKRMKPDFIISYIKNPASWDQHSMMPNRHLKESDIHALVDYLKLIGEKTP